MPETPSPGGVIHTPPTPLHGATVDSWEPYSPRYQTRATSRKLIREAHSTPEPVNRNELDGRQSRNYSPASKSNSRQNLHPTLSPPQSSRRSPKRKISNRMFPTLPPSPDGAIMDDFVPAVPHKSTTSSSEIFSSSTTIHGGMLPTPVKTPRKKKVANVEAAARALFQDQPEDLEEVVSSSKRSKKSRRYNGFSLESFSVDEGDSSNQIQIFTDSKDKIPELDLSENNPFIDHDDTAAGESTSSKPVRRTSKRRKISGASQMDKDVEEAIKNDKGMIYVFRGKKIFRAFDSDEEDEELDPSDLGLTESAENGVHASEPLRTLTRKSIKPTRLFQTEEQKRSREAEKEEEALTDIEDNSKDNEQIEVIDLITPNETSTVRHDPVPAIKGPGKPLLSKIAKGHLESDSDGSQSTNNSKSKKASPFDSWKRVKQGTVHKSPGASKGKKRVAETLSDDEASKKQKA